MTNVHIDKRDLLAQLMAIKDWRHPFDFGEKKVVSFEREELGPWNKWRADVSRRSIEMVMDVDKFSILDLACNDGYYSFQLADKAKSVVGLDARDECIKRARLIKQYYGYSNFEFKQVDLRGYDFKIEDTNNIFNLVLCYGILYHLTDPYDFLKRVSKVTNNTLSLSTFLCNSKLPILTVTKEDVTRPGSGLDAISTLPSHQAVVRLLYGVGFDLVMRYIPYKLSLYHHFEWGHFFAVKLGCRSKDDYIKLHNVRANYNRFTNKDQLVLCGDMYDISGLRRTSTSNSCNFFQYDYFIYKIRRRIKKQFHSTSFLRKTH